MGFCPVAGFKQGPGQLNMDREMLKQDTSSQGLPQMMYHVINIQSSNTSEADPVPYGFSTAEKGTPRRIVSIAITGPWIDLQLAHKYLGSPWVW
jgi:hypothetical protein